MPKNAAFSACPTRALHTARISAEPAAFSLGGLSKRKLTHIGRVPAVQAILIQGIALVTVLLAVIVVSAALPFRFPFFSLVCIQAMVAAGLCAVFGMARWWRWIHFGFPLALWGMSQWQVPNELYLIGFLVSLSLFWTTFRSQVPFYPSRPKVWRKIAEIIPQNQAIRMIDIGSGLGDLAMYVAKQRPESRIEGIEIAPLPLLASQLRAWLKSSKARFFRGDFYTLDFAQYDVVFAYLSPAAMSALWQKAQHEMRAGTYLMSYEFDIPGLSPNKVIKVAEGLPNIYVWEIQQ